MRIDKAAILAALGSLSPQERSEIAAACTALGTAKSQQGAVEEASDLLWRGYARHMRGSVLVPPVGVMCRTQGWSAFERAADALEPWIVKHFQPVDQQERRHAYNLVARCILTSLSARDIPWNARVLMQQAANATQAVEAEFPGYAAAGVLRRTLQVD